MMISKTRQISVAGSKIVLLFSITFVLFLLNSCSSIKKTKTSQPTTKITQATVKPERKPDITLTSEDSPPLLKVEQIPEFVGGYPALMKFLRDKVQYPTSAQASKIQGTVFVQFVVKKTGQIANVKILRGIGGGCDEEAMRVVKEMPNWIPGKEKGEVVNVMFQIPIKFQLQINYEPINSGNK